MDWSVVLDRTVCRFLALLHFGSSGRRASCTCGNGKAVSVGSQEWDGNVLLGWLFLTKGCVFVLPFLGVTVG